MRRDTGALQACSYFGWVVVVVPMAVVVSAAGCWLLAAAAVAAVCRLPLVVLEYGVST